MRIDIVTLFPRMFEGVLAASIVGRAQRAGKVAVRTVDLRQYCPGPHRSADDTPYGGGPGMVLRPEPWGAALAALGPDPAAAVVLLSPQGEVLTQRLVRALAERAHLILLCGHYEGVDDRVRSLCTHEVSIGDYVLTGGEPAAWVLTDAVVRLLPGVIDPASLAEESFAYGLLEGPQYTRPREVFGLRVPDVLLTGDHARIARFRRQEALWRTLERRPDLLRGAVLARSDAELLRAKVRATPRRPSWLAAHPTGAACPRTKE